MGENTQIPAGFTGKPMKIILFTSGQQLSDSVQCLFGKTAKMAVKSRFFQVGKAFDQQK
ncbi:hypothetical protein GCM10028804_02510 [Larkinella terrae]